MTTINPIRPPMEDDQDTEDMTCEFLLLGGASLAATYLATGGNLDLIALPGAMLGAVVALLKATQEKRAWTDKGIVVIGASVIGTTAPSVAVHVFWPDWLEKLTWHVFFLAGFILSIIGWMLIWPFILALDARRDRIAKRALDALERKYGMRPDQDSKDGRGGRP